MNSSLSVALILSAVNNMSPVLTSAVRQVKNVEESVKKLNNINPSGKWDDKYFDNAMKKMDEYKLKGEDLKRRGREQMLTGVIELGAVKQAVDKASEFESVMKKVELANYDANVPLKIQEKQLKNLSNQALKLGADTVFSNTDAAKAQLALIKNGMEYKDVLEGGAKAAVYLAQTAEISCEASADAVSQVTNMFQLQGSQLMKTADDINRAANASSAGVENIMHDLQQVGSTAHTVGINVKDTTLLLGTLHNMGLADSSGTFLNDLLLRLDPVSDKAAKALNSLGLLEGATVKKTKSGKIKISGGESSVFDETGHVKNAQTLVNKLRQTLYNAKIDPNKMIDKKGNMLSDAELKKMFGGKKANQVLNEFKSAFGVQGMRAAVALTVSGKGSFEEMTAKAKRAKELEKQVQEMQSTFSGIVESIQGSIETLLTSAGTPLLQQLKEIGQNIVGVINKLTAWTQAHPELAGAILKTVAYLGILNLSLGAGKLMFGNVLELFAGGGKTILGSIKYLKGFGESYSFLTKQMGYGNIGGFFRSFTFGTKADGIVKGIASFSSKAGTALKNIGTGALDTVKKIGDIGVEFIKTGAKATASGVKMAGAWIKAGGKEALNVIKTIGKVGAEFIKTGAEATVSGIKMAGAWLKNTGASALNGIKNIGLAGAEFIKTGAKAAGAGITMAGAWVKNTSASALNAIKTIGLAGIEFVKTGAKATAAGIKMAAVWIKSAGAGALSAIKTVATVGGQFILTGAKALIAGGQMALAWVIGLGPVAWIIAGVTVIVGAAIAAWVTNFGGFRDKVKAVFSVIGSFISSIVEGVKSVWNTAVEWISSRIESILGVAKKIIDNPIVKGVIGIGKSVVNGIGDFFSGDKKSTQTIKNNRSDYHDNRNITYNVSTKDPRLAADQIASKNNDKYIRSRNPVLSR